MGRILELSSLCSGLQNLFWVQYKGHKVCLSKILTHGIFKLLSEKYFQNMYMRFLVEKISGLLCFLDGLGIALPVLVIRNI